MYWHILPWNQSFPCVLESWIIGFRHQRDIIIRSQQITYKIWLFILRHTKKMRENVNYKKASKSNWLVRNVIYSSFLSINNLINSAYEQKWIAKFNIQRYCFVLLPFNHFLINHAKTSNNSYIDRHHNHINYSP